MKDTNNGTLATVTDLMLEQWLRKREQGKIVWKTRDDRLIPIKDMTDQHLDNTIKMINRKEDYEAMCYAALGSIGDSEYFL